MRKLDSFEEFDPATATQGRMVDVRGKLQTRSVSKLVEYLRSAPVVIDIMERRRDIFDGSFVAETGSYRSDGEWYWRDDLSHYVEVHQVCLLEEFVRAVEQRDFSPVALSEAEARAASEAIMVGW